jgi:hypothetical protein
LRSGDAERKTHAAQEIDREASPFCHAVRLVYTARFSKRLLQQGSKRMIRVVIDTVLFCCMGAFVTGIVLVAAKLVI